MQGKSQSRKIKNGLGSESALGQAHMQRDWHMHVVCVTHSKHHTYTYTYTHTHIHRGNYAFTYAQTKYTF